MERKLKFWRIIRLVCILLLAALGAGLVYTALKCMEREYPVPMMGIDVNSWFEAFCFEVGLYLVIGGIFPAAAVVLLIIACIKIKKYKSCENNGDTSLFLNG